MLLVKYEITDWGWNEDNDEYPIYTEVCRIETTDEIVIADLLSCDNWYTEDIAKKLL